MPTALHSIIEKLHSLTSPSFLFRLVPTTLFGSRFRLDCPLSSGGFLLNPSRSADIVDSGGNSMTDTKRTKRLGENWILVTPDKNWFHTSDADMAFDILSRSREFGRPVWMSSKMTDQRSDVIIVNQN